MRRAPLLGSLLTLLACSTLVPSEVLVHIDADTISRKRARQLHVRIVSQEGATRLDRTASLFGQPPEVELPTTVPVVPVANDSSRTFTLFAELTDQENVAFNKKAATLSFVDDALKDVELYFSDLCIDIDCPEGQTCSDGSCVDIKTPPHGPDGPLASDAQAAYCEGPLCWEEPRPGGDGVTAACLWAPDAGLALGPGWEIQLTGQRWISTPSRPHHRPRRSRAGAAVRPSPPTGQASSSDPRRAGSRSPSGRPRSTASGASTPTTSGPWPTPARSGAARAMAPGPR